MPKEIFVDGGSSGNPGFSRIAIASEDLKKTRNIGYGTNNRAEYLALIYGLLYAKHIGEPVVIKADSQLVVNQVNGNYKVKSVTLQPLYQRARQLLSEIPHPVEITWIPRGRNLAGHMLE